MTIVRHCDMSALRFCNRGARLFCERHGIDWNEFVTKGIDAERVSDIDDAMLSEVIERARRREAKDK
jgi:hypothetical protein